MRAGGRGHETEGTSMYRSGLRILVLVAAAACVGGYMVSAPALARTAGSLSFAVTTTADTHDALPGDGSCADSTGQCSLRAAIEESNAAPVGATTSVTVP